MQNTHFLPRRVWFYFDMCAFVCKGRFTYGRKRTNLFGRFVVAAADVIAINCWFKNRFFSVCLCDFSPVHSQSSHISVSISAIRKMYARQHRFIYLSAENILWAFHVSDCDWCSIENVESVIWFEIGSSILRSVCVCVFFIILEYLYFFGCWLVGWQMVDNVRT